MRTLFTTTLATVALTAVTFALPAQAAPSTPRMEGTSAIVKARCWWRGGARVCDGWGRHAHYGYRAYRGYGAYPTGRPEDYRIGSSRWWRAMDRDCRGGFRC